MAPQDYLQARTATANGNNKDNEHWCTRVDGRPYFPSLKMDPTSDDSIKQVTYQVVRASLGEEFNNKNGNNATQQQLQLLQVTCVKGGNTNQLFRVSNLQQALASPNSVHHHHRLDELLEDSVLIRIFGAAGMIDRDVETSTYAALASSGLIPAYHGRFQNGRLEAWLEGMRPLTDDELLSPSISKAIANRMAQLHATFVVPPHLKSHHDMTKPACLWTQLNDWMSQALRHHASQSFVNAQDYDRCRALVPTLVTDIPQQLAWLQDTVIPAITTDARVDMAFCHNDVLAANIMLSTTSTADTNHDDNNDNGNTTNDDDNTLAPIIHIQLIDFEYGGINYRAFDIANHFNEFAGGFDDGIPKYDKFPSRDFQRTFLQHYARAYRDYKQQRTSTTTTTPDNTDNGIMSTDMDHFHHQVDAFVLVDHLYWGLWGVVQAATDGCHTFDYLLYGSKRLEEYYHCLKSFQA